MTKENFERVLAAFLKRTPFEPFSLELVNGTRLEVNHPEALELSQTLIVCKSTNPIKSVFEYDAVARFVDATGG
jgi:hypothetical protein